MSHSKQYSRDRQREVRARVYPPHDYVKSTHCRACDNTYKREHKRRPKPVRLSEVSTFALRKELIRRAQAQPHDSVELFVSVEATNR